MDRARAAHSKAQRVLDKYGSTIQWVDTGLAVVAAVPGFASACGALRGLIGSVERTGELAQDVLDTLEAVLEAVDHLRRIKESVEKAGVQVKAQLDRDMARVQRAIEDITGAIDTVNQKGVVKAALTAVKAAKTLSRLADKLEKALAKIDRTLQLESFKMALEGLSASVRDLTSMVGKKKDTKVTVVVGLQGLPGLPGLPGLRMGQEQAEMQIWQKRYTSLKILPKIKST